MKPKEYFEKCIRELHAWNDQSIENTVDLGAEGNLGSSISMAGRRDSTERAARTTLTG